MSVENSDRAVETSWEFEVVGDPHEQPGPMEILAAALIARTPPMPLLTVATDVASVVAGSPGPASAPTRAPARRPLIDAAPIASWEGVALACGVDAATVRRVRRDHGDTKKMLRPTFGSGAEARAWWAQLRAGGALTPAPAAAPVGAKPRKKKSLLRPDHAVAVDWSKE